jgi:hypothetical protein
MTYRPGVALSWSDWQLVAAVASFASVIFSPSFATVMMYPGSIRSSILYTRWKRSSSTRFNTGRIWS